jgi:hypothetical protein
VNKPAIVVVVVLLLNPAEALAGGSARIAQGFRTAGVKASATATYSRPSRQSAARGYSAEQVAGVRYSRGVVLAPLVGQVLCGHDPRIPGGLTCALSPLPRPQVADAPRRRRPPNPEDVARALADRTIALAPRPQLRFAPARRGLTGLPSYFWLAQRPQPIVARAGAGSVTVTAEARPVQFVWNYGDGTDHATRGPGRRWTKKRLGTIKHTYEGKGRYPLEVEVIWQARWRMSLGPWRSLGYFSNSTSRTYRVRSMVPVLVRAR